jgi:predicted glycoside hydrolase/deacetylase ChbG (UPF0249 family)
MWSSVAGVVSHATADEVDQEMHAQLDRAERMGFHPTHFDTHMGTVFSSPAFLARYVQFGIEKQFAGTQRELTSKIANRRKKEGARHKCGDHAAGARSDQ